MTIAGNNLGPSYDSEVWTKLHATVSAVYGNVAPFNKYTATNCRVLGHQSMTCATAMGIGGGHQWIATIAGQTCASQSTGTMKASFAANSLMSTEYASFASCPMPSLVRV